MTREELEKEIERVENAIFMEQMADFMNWGNYYRLKNEYARANRVSISASRNASTPRFKRSMRPGSCFTKLAMPPVRNAGSLL